MEGEEEERLVQAAQYGKLDVLQAFHLNKGVAAHGSKSHALTHDIKDWAGDTLLSIACWHGHRAVCEFLMDLGADVNSRNSNLNTPLHRAAYKGDLDIVSLVRE
jgi:ankyrin repeat protein